MPAHRQRLLGKRLADIFRQHHAEKAVFGHRIRGAGQQRLMVERGGVARLFSLRRGALHALLVVRRVADDQVVAGG